ncbi:hypothetical protein RF55_4500 [Lasius niger]|uniref:Uncharacterized protein n=1 Tax=Lasius niger TaxID=67767 RepID=A0A0J7KY91_LASNI|nr:hypothetical protein RF55_4500 [Lasius niger]
MFRDVAKYVKRYDASDDCQHTKVKQAKPAGLMGHRIVEGLDCSGCRHDGTVSEEQIEFRLCFGQDLFTKWVEYFALRAANGKKICKALKKIVSR